MSLTKEQQQRIHDSFVMQTPFVILHWATLAMIIYGSLGIIVNWNSIEEMAIKIDYYCFYGKIFLNPWILLAVFMMAMLFISSSLIKHYFFKKFHKHVSSFFEFNGTEIDFDNKQDEDKK